MTHVLMIASENDALPGGKVGGIGDVVRSAPAALAARGCTVSVLTPSYGVFASEPGARVLAQIELRFAGAPQLVDLVEVPGRQPTAHVRQLVLDHPSFSACGLGRIYCDDPPGRPFATDATKFALFCAAAMRGLVLGSFEGGSFEGGSFEGVDVLHLHDWHAAFALMLRRYDPSLRHLRSMRCAFTIHNLALQGIRPFKGDESSLEAWFPELSYSREQLADPRWPECVNPMAAAVRLADAVHTVSPSYADEVLAPSAVEARGAYGGEGLEADLRTAKDEGRLIGILNGCEYPQAAAPRAPWPAFVGLMKSTVLRWAGAGSTVSSAHFIARARLDELGGERPGLIVTSVGRLTDQKVRLLREATAQDRPALEEVLDAIGERGIFVLLGNGDAALEQFLTQTAARYANFIFLRGYCDALAQAIYATGDLFLMPSSFEPCGISQMLALRAGQPCVVHGVGGLKDTVRDGTTGFVFTGSGFTEQAHALVATVQRALSMHESRPEQWQAMRRNAAKARFPWSESAGAYVARLYQHEPGG